MERCLFVLLPAVVLDWLIGDPHWMPHPVRWMGRFITWLEPVLRGLFPKTPGGERVAGCLLVLAVGLLFPLAGWVLLVLCRMVSPWLAWGVEVWFTGQLLAARSLAKESMAVCSPLRSGDLAGARYAVSRIVGRDTDVLDEAGVTRAAVETVAENTSDGVIAPMLYLALGGLPLGLLYKAVNTMDSMVGYRNQRYRYFGTAAARLDDLLNLIPARLSGLVMCLAAAILPGCSGPGAWRIFWRDRLRHKSPNSAHTEAACAGALGVRLAGDGVYFGQVVKKPFIGDPIRPVEPEDIPRACRLMYVTQVLTLLLLLGGGAVFMFWERRPL